ncbi:vacuolar iron transporter homolog 2.1-like [Gastrolobium bilobum]|uniref:vacuolar iron transporter homolog 2.1-like n=1 Tax=Gastrolobium bilobum TaxID=150636 RepID=UPI002AB26127|nr:vacuolar iron transporter homolog 2.1-like [Gastrolobium bilobum]
MSERGGSSGGATARLLQEVVEDGGDDLERKSERPKEPWKGEYVKSIVFAGHDAIITCFSLISSISASSSSSADVLVLGFANLVADAISMGFGDFVSVSSEQDVIIEERRVTEWDVMNHRGNEQTELVRYYQALGMDYNDASMVVNIFTKYKDVLVDQRMVADKGMLPADQEVKPWKNGLVTFASFMVFGSIPLLSFIILIPFTDSDSVKFVSACLVSTLGLALLGVAKARISGQNMMFSVAITVFSGAIAAAAAYLVGWSLKHIA